MDEPTLMMRGYFNKHDIQIYALPSGDYSAQCDDAIGFRPVEAPNPQLAVKLLVDAMSSTPDIPFDYHPPICKEHVYTWNNTIHDMDDQKNHYGRWTSLNDAGGVATVVITKEYDINLKENGEGGFVAWCGEPDSDDPYNEHFTANGDAEIEAVDFVRDELSRSIDAGFELL